MGTKSRYWEKLWHDLLKDRKVGVLPDALKWRFVSCILLAGIENEGGWLPRIDEAAFELGIPEAQLALELPVLAQRGLLELGIRPDGEERWFVTNWAKRQAPASSTDRVQAFRQRQREVKQDGNGSETKRFTNRLSAGDGEKPSDGNDFVSDEAENETISFRSSAASASSVYVSDLGEIDLKATAEAADENVKQVRYWLRKAGIGSNSGKFRQLLQADLDWQYVRAHVLERLADPIKTSTGLLITKLLSRDDPPPPRCPDCYTLLVSGEYCRSHGYIGIEDEEEEEQKERNSQETGEDEYVF